MDINHQLNNLVRRLRAFPDAAAAVSTIRSDLPQEWSLPFPTVTWVVIGLLHYRRRKRWAWRVAHARLGRRIRRHLDSVGQARMTIDKILASAKTGAVPGLAGWEYHLDGNESYLLNRATGEFLHLDLLNGPDVIGTGHFLDYLDGLRTPGPAQQRLRQLYSRDTHFRHTLRTLRQAGLLYPVDEHAFVVCRRLAACSRGVAQLLAAWEDPRARPWLTAWLGDWGGAAESIRELMGFEPIDPTAGQEE